MVCVLSVFSQDAQIALNELTSVVFGRTIYIEGRPQVISHTGANLHFVTW